MPNLNNVFSKDGLLAAHVERFSVRPQQRQMAESIAAVLYQEGASLVCEAGTGTGKTFAYLIPALLEEQKKILISTGTKHLQDQLYYKDLPIARKALNVPINAALLKGRANYLCLHRLQNREENSFYILPEDRGHFSMVERWATETKSGDLAELTALPEYSSLRSGLVSNSENCLGQECSFYDQCFVFKARREASEAELIVVNHHLLLSDMALRETGFGEVLPKADVIIFDEAHQLPALASEFFSKTVSSRQLNELFMDSMDSYLKDANDMPDTQVILERIKKDLSHLRLSFGLSEQQRVAWHQISAQMETQQALRSFNEKLATLEKCLDELSQRSKSLDNCWRRCKQLLDQLHTFEEKEDVDSIQWLETRGQGFLLHQTPLEIADIFQLRLEEYRCSSVYLSATLSVAGDFSHFVAQLGLLEASSESWPSPFNYAQQALLYLPKRIPNPREETYIQAVVDAALPVIIASRGRTFFLFTSHHALRTARQLLANKIDYPLLVQGDAPRSELLKIFRTQQPAVLLGTSSFWEGVDVRGAALSCVIIDKLPFASPSDPVFQARSARMKAQGREPFMEYTIPQAVIALRQGVGRLIRDETDYGVLMICDPRLLGKYYGKIFLASLPDIPHTRDISDVESFFDAINTEDNATN